MRTENELPQQLEGSSWGQWKRAEDSEFENNDNTALAIAMVDGLVRTMGDDQVRSQVRKDGNVMLRLAIEMVAWQPERGHRLLKDRTVNHHHLEDNWQISETQGLAEPQLQNRYR